MYSLTSRERTFTLVGILVGLFLGALDQTIVGTAMPRILQQLNGLNLYTWVVTAYLLASTAMIPIYGKLSDLYGRKVVILAGIVLFLVGSALSGQARSMIELVAFRAVQGLGSAGIFSTAFTVVADLFAPADRGKYQGLFGAVFGIASVIGPWLGGIITDGLSWRWVFYVNVPIGLVAIAFIVIAMPPLAPDGAKGAADTDVQAAPLAPAVKRKVRIDWLGTATLLFAVVPLLLALSLGGVQFPWGSWQTIGLFALGAAGTALFVLVERRAAEPILPFDLFRNRTYVTGNIAAMLVAGVAFFGAIVFLPVYMVLVTGVSASQAGLSVTPLTLGLVVGSFVSGQIVSRIRRYKAIILIGVAIVVVGYILMLGLTEHTTQRQVVWRMVILGLGLGPSLPVFVLAVQNAVDPSEMGAATSSSQFFRQIGSVVGVAVFGTILTTILTARLAVYLPPEMQQAGAASFSMGQLESGDFSAVSGGIREAADRSYATIEKAIRGNDPQAVQSLLADPQAPQQVKSLLRGGGIAAEVHVAVATQEQLVAETVRVPSYEAWQGLMGDQRLSPQLRASLAGVQPASLADPARARQLLAGVHQQLSAAEPAMVEQAVSSTLASIRQAVDAQAEKVTAQVTGALKKAFTEAITRVFFWGVFVVVLGFIVTLFLPELALRGKPSEPAGAGEARMRPAAAEDP